jgi:hypothetical protein
VSPSLHSVKLSSQQFHYRALLFLPLPKTRSHAYSTDLRGSDQASLPLQPQSINMVQKRSMGSRGRSHRSLHALHLLLHHRVRKAGLHCFTRLINSRAVQSLLPAVVVAASNHRGVRDGRCGCQDCALLRLGLSTHLMVRRRGNERSSQLSA